MSELPFAVPEKCQECPVIHLYETLLDDITDTLKLADQATLSTLDKAEATSIPDPVISAGLAGLTSSLGEKLYADRDNLQGEVTELFKACQGLRRRSCRSTALQEYPTEARRFDVESQVYVNKNLKTLMKARINLMNRET